MNSLQVRRVAPAARVSRARTVKVQAISDVNVVISGATFGMLALGRFAFLPYQRRSSARAGQPMQNGTTHFRAGDIRAEEVPFLASNDPAGFNIIDVFAWGALGHALGYAALALSH